MLRRFLLVLLTALLLAACSEGGTDDPSRSPSADPEPDAQLVDWLDHFCEDFYHPEVRWPDDLAVPETTTEADRQPLLDTLAELDDLLTEVDQAAAAQSPAPTDASQELLDRYRESYAEHRAGLAELAEEATWFPAEELDVTYRLSATSLVSFVPLDVGLDVLAEYEDLASAAEHAPSCPEIDPDEGTTT